MEPVHTYFDSELNCEVKVYPPQESRTRRTRRYIPMKVRDERRRQSSLKQMNCLNAYDAAVSFGMQREEAPETSNEFEVALRKERARFNRRHA